MDYSYDQIIEEHLALLRPAMDRWITGDLMGYANLIAEKATYFDPRTNGQILGREELIKHYKPGMGTFSFPEAEFSNMELQIIGDNRILTYNWTEIDDQGKPMSVWNSTEVWSQIDNQWQIIHAHWSVIPDKTG